MSELQEFRERKDAFLRQHPQSPLMPKQKQDFQGLRYYPENPALRLDLRVNMDVPHDEIVMDTSTGERQNYTRVGKVAFEVDGEQTELYLYGTEGSRGLFVPFRDATSGNETYGGGRYLEVEAEDDGSLLLDLNYAYNPYCAYNDQWSCPLPPPENWLKVPIRAGEMAYDKEWGA
jgi:uncharacterized protein (DUF1684 family)